MTVRQISQKEQNSSVRRQPVRCRLHYIARRRMPSPPIRREEEERNTISMSMASMIHDIRRRRHCDINTRYPMRLRRVSSRNQLPIAHHHLVFGKSPDVKGVISTRRRFQQLGFGQCHRLVSQDSRIRMSLSSTVISYYGSRSHWFMSISCLFIIYLLQWSLMNTNSFFHTNLSTLLHCRAQNRYDNIALTSSTSTITYAP